MGRHKYLLTIVLVVGIYKKILYSFPNVYTRYKFLKW